MHFKVIESVQSSLGDSSAIVMPMRRIRTSSGVTMCSARIKSVVEQAPSELRRLPIQGNALTDEQLLPMALGRPNASFPCRQV
jgi:hypothetical protein